MCSVFQCIISGVISGAIILLVTGSFRRAPKPRTPYKGSLYGVKFNEKDKE